MTWLHSLIIGIIQGLTEFLPISSSAHMEIAEKFFHLPSIAPKFKIICHLGTTLAIIIIFKKEIIKALKSPKYYYYFTIALLPLIPFYLLFQLVKMHINTSFILGACLIVSSFFLFYIKFSNQKIYKEGIIIKTLDVLFIGIMQAFALLPGISRSGATISAAYLRGWKMKEAVNFSFLLAIPTILGGMFLELYKELYITLSSDPIPYYYYLTGFISAFIIGIFTIKYFLLILTKKKIFFIGIYWLFIGMFLMLIQG